MYHCVQTGWKTIAYLCAIALDENLFLRRLHIMITKQHTAIYVLSLAINRDLTEGSSEESLSKFENTLHNEIPWLLLPDAIRAYIRPRQASHFERIPGKEKDTSVSWMEFPSEEVLKNLSKENASEMISFSVGEYPTCVIGEDTEIGEFDIRNVGHRHYEALRCHLVQDLYLDECLRKRLINAEKRFTDTFVIRHSEEEIDGAQLRAQVALFEELGFIKLVGMVYEKTGILLNREWFDTHVLESLKKAYPEDLAENTYKYMSISDEVNERINALDFELTSEEKASVILTDDLDRVLNEMYSYAIRATRYDM